ncbi:M15 family metallopeptidase [Actinophytocola oryzae]|uniref:D-alanyl-D-alanine dipeptidase n=1 Tax=Actinophytocola oryzae TaxID=502181 RepID=A0A4R7W0M7_9PSEU|nr:M15 family metallopeptidase [Actinophytocola oryzae]TDV56063.1 D-Ala-D-Ala dipeptidase VanX [Actinophytocola oryzae]
MSRLSRLGAVVLAVLSCVALAAPASASERDRVPAGFVALHDIDPTIRYDIRYFTRHNFVGERIDGYLQPECILTREAATALRTAQRSLIGQGYTLKVYDCYRPQRAVDHFVRWAEDLDDDRMKAEFYPDVDKTRLFADGYIAEKSGHSRGSTFDVTLVRLPVRPQRPYRPGEPLVACYAPVGQRFPDNTVDMGTGYDCFDPLSHTDNPAITGAARHHRDLLRDTLVAAGFHNLAEEWWHYTLDDEPYPDTYFDFPVTHHG